MKVKENKKKKEKKISYEKGIEIVRAIEKKLEELEKRKSSIVNHNEYSL